MALRRKKSDEADRAAEAGVARQGATTGDESTALVEASGEQAAAATTEVRPDGANGGAQADQGRESVSGPVGQELAQAGADSEGGEPGPGGGPGRASDDESGSSPVEQAQSLAERRPELVVGAAFMGGLVAARLLGALGGKR